MFAMLMCWSIVSLQAQTEVIAGWTFGTVTGEESLLADQGNFNNVGIQQLSLTNTNTITFVGGSPGRAATATGWNNFDIERFWLVSVNTIGFESLTLSSKQQSSNTGPRDFKAQYSLDGSSWTDIPGADITTANNFTTGVLNKISLPQAANNNASVFIRWFNTSSTSVGDATIASTGTSRIDEIFIEGLALGEPLDPTATPIISPSGGIYEEVQSVTITSETEGANIYYTLDGSVPNLGSTLYTGTISIEESAVLSAIAFADGFAVSEAASAEFTINLPAVPASRIPYIQNFENFVSLSNPVSTFGVDGEWTFEGSVRNYNGLFDSGTAGGFRGGDVLGYQHSGTSGVLNATLTLENTTGFPISDLEISYLGKVGRADQTRFPEWTVTINGTEYPELSYSTASGVDQTVSAIVSDLNILPGELVIISWSSDRGFNAGGASRQIGITDLSVTIPEILEPVEFVNWDFTGAPGNQATTTGTALVQGVFAKDFARGSGINPANAMNSISSNGWNAGEDRYFTFGFNVAGDKLIDLTQLQIGSTSSGTGPRDLALVYSGDGFTSRLAEWEHTGSFVNQVIDLSGLQNLSGDIEFRIISTSDVSASGGTIGSGGTLRVTNFFPGTLPVTFIGIVKEADGVIIPGLTTDPTSLEFGSVSKSDDAPVLSYTLSAVNLENGVTVSATAPYAVSKDGTTFSPSIEFTLEEMASAQTVFVQLDNSAEGNFNGTISNTTDGATPVSVNVTSSVFDPFNITENFNNICQANLGGIGGSWSTFSVAGDQVWSCTNFGRAGTTPTASAPFGVQISGFSGGAVLNEDWLISAPYDLTGFNIPLMTFWSRVAFEGPRLKLLISTDYTNGNPNDASWTELSDRFATANEWTFSGQVDLTPYLNETVRIAFVYASSPETGAARWTLDDFALFSSDVPAEPFFTNNIGNVDYWHFGIVPVGETSTETRTFNFGLSNPAADLTITGGDGFEFSKDGSAFSPSLTYSPIELTGQKTVTVRFAPTSEGAFAAPINFESGDINITRGYLTGATVNKDETFDVVNWNIEWFGSTNSGQGPTNVNLQLENVKKVIEDLDADVYAFQEITSLAKFTELADALPGYGMAVSPATSAGGEFAEEAQKLTYLFKLATVDTIQTRVLLKGVETSDLIGYPSSPDRFWASGRLPYLMDIKTNINGVQQNITLVNVHTRSNGGGESASNPRYAMRKYDVNVLKDSLDMYYSDVNLILLGDFNDDLDETVANQTAATVNTTETSFINYINDTENYNPITISLSNAGLRTFPTFENVIDHQIISTELVENWIVNSERIVAPYGLIANYDNTTSDHLPVESRFIFKCDLEQAQVIASENEVCAGSNSIDFELVGGRFDSIVGWEISTDEGASWTLIEGTAELSEITVENLESASLVRAIIDSNICEPIATEAVAITVKSLPTPFIAFESGKLFTLEGDYSYQWFKNGVLVAISTINETRIQGAGIYTVLITDTDGCSSLSEEYAFPTIKASNKTKVFPNPTSRIVNVELRRTEGLQNVELRTANGLLIESIISTGELVQFDVSSLAKGVYLIMITDRNGITTVERLIVR
ncbi:hypothetical protein GCM10010993_29360 [Belliella aquatica]|uniref:Por secretion system C-terminal sorting domain-containing protein n=2 Tax=Belliella aquatica TaxID=1323734 RepID=A0ABQ1MXQ0_9BACT|nr:hypothetical protein GCM10010993_29360 [Belliella aquatica]